MDSQTLPNRYRWYLLALCGLTNAVVIAAQPMAMSVLFKDIATELGLNLVQVGQVWGIGGLPLVLMALIAGQASDRFGIKRVMLITVALAGIAGALRGLAGSFVPLLLTVLLLGAVTPFVNMSGFKIVGVWFPPRQLGLANGVLSVGMALGFLLGSMLSASVISPWLGGWRQVFFFFGGISLLLVLPWAFSHPVPAGYRQMAGAQPVFSAVRHVVSNRNAWLLGCAILGLNGGVQGVLGYLPLFLRNQGWLATQADGTLALFHTMSLLMVMPLALFSDRLKSRKALLAAAMTLIMTGCGLLALVDGIGVWVAVVLAGIMRDGSMALFFTIMVEMAWVGPRYAGTATSFLIMFSGLGSLIAPPLGNSLAGFAGGAPFLFWSGMVAVGIVCLLLVRATRRLPAAVTTPEVGAMPE